MTDIRRKRFIHAYLGEAGGNATQAAILAGYSPKTAGQQASRLLKAVEIQRELQKRTDRLDISTETSLQNVARIAHKQAPDAVETRDILKANELLLKVSGALTERRQQDSRIVVNIGFLTQPAALTIDTQAISANMQPDAPNMPPQAQVTQSDAS